MAGNSKRVRKAIVVQARDRQLLSELGVMRVIDREQAKAAAGFTSTTRANTRLLRLTRAGFLRRFFLGTATGGRKALYALSATGAKLIGIPYRGPRRRQDESLVADFFVQHQLAINEIYCTLKFQPLPTGVRFQRWLAFHEPFATGLQLIPDGYVELQTPSGTLAAFLEVDLGHEGLTVWRKKVANYLQLALSSDWVRRFGQQRFRVLVVAHSDRRLTSIRKLVAGSTKKIFWFRSLDSIARSGFFAAEWLRPADDTKQSLTEELS